MPLFRNPGRAAPTEEDHRLLRGSLGRLDPWAFWSIALADPDADYAVIGATGAFAIQIVGLEGFVEPSGSGLRVGDAAVTGFREVTRAARRLHVRLIEASAFTQVEPLLCLTRARAGSSRTVRGVRVVRLEDLPGEIGGRERALDPGTAKRAAEALGRVLPSASGPRSDAED